jgi:hypothetical protein
MLILTYLPAFITTVFQGMPGTWKGQHRLILCWLIVMQAIYPGRKTFHELARWSPRQITEWRFRRLLKASSRDWNFAFAIPTTWKTAEDKSVKDLVTHLPRHDCKRTWIPRLSERLYRKTYWVDAKRLCLRDIGEVTLVLSKTGRNV